MNRTRRITDPNLIAIAHLVRLLQDNRELDNRQLADQCGLSYLTVCRYTAAFRQVDAAYVAARKPDARGALRTRVYALGVDRLDVAIPRETQAQKMRRLRRKWKLVSAD